MDQKIDLIHIKSLVLWTENPRDPIDENASDQDIVDKALEDKRSKWKLTNIAKEMGEYYDFSELPTVVYHGDKPVVYDGNRRIILGKIKHGIVSTSKGKNVSIPYFPEYIPCNVCTERIALNNVFRKHSNSGSWQPLERDIFLHKFMGEEKSLLLILEEETHIISNNPHMNQRYVKDEILREGILHSIGFSIHNGKLHSVHDEEEAQNIFNDIISIVADKKVTTREKRGNIIEVLDEHSKKIINKNKNNKEHKLNISFEKKEQDPEKRRSKRTNKKEFDLFSGPLYLKPGIVSDLYRDISDLCSFYLSNSKKLSSSFSSIIRMSLRLLCETAAQEDNGKKLDSFIYDYFDEAKNKLDKDNKTYLHTHNVNKKNVVSLLHIGAHNYKSSDNFEQTKALSIIVGHILTITHGK